MGLPAEDREGRDPDFVEASSLPHSQIYSSSYTTVDEGDAEASGQLMVIHLALGLFFVLNVLLFHLLLRFEIFPVTELDLPLLFALISGTFGLISTFFCTLHLWPEVARIFRQGEISAEPVVLLGLWFSAASMVVAGLTDQEFLIDAVLAENLVVCAFLVNAWLYLDRSLSAKFREFSCVGPGDTENSYRKIAGLVEGGGTETREMVTSLSSIAVGDVLALGDGESVPADGTILSGTCEVSERRYAGRELPRFLSPGQEIIRGSKIVRGQIHYRADLQPDESRVSYFSDAFSQCSVPDTESKSGAMRRLMLHGGVLFLAACVAMFWNDQMGFSASLFLVASSVLFLSVLLSLFRYSDLIERLAMSGLFVRGVLCRGREVLRRLTAVRELLYDIHPEDAPGTPQVASFEIFDDRLSRDELIPVLLGLFGSSSDEIALEVTGYLLQQESNPKLYEVLDFHEWKGKGFSGVVSGAELSVGTEEFLIERGVLLQESELRVADGDETWIYVAIGDDPVAGIEFTSSFRLQGKKQFSRLRSRGVRTQLMSAAMNESELDALGKQVGLELAEISGGLTEEQYLRKIETLPKALLVANRFTPREVRRSPELVADYFDEVHFELDHADLILFDRDSSSLTSAVVLSRVYAGIKKFSLSFVVLSTILLALAGMSAVLAPAAVLFIAVVCWAVVALNVFRLGTERRS